MPFVRTSFLCGCLLSLAAPVVHAQSDGTPTDTGGEYTGPAILSRGETPLSQTASPLGFRPYIGLNAIYDTGVAPVAINSAGNVPSSDIFGLELNLGAYTYHSWKHTTLALDYRGDFRHYPDATYWDGTDQFLSLILKHQPNKRLTFTVRENAGTYSRNYYLTSALGALDPNYLLVPQNDIFDNRVIFAGASADVTYQKSARLSFNIGGEGSVVRRQSTALYGVTVGVARADMEYRIKRHSTIGVDYRFSYYQYTRGFGDTQLNSVGLNYSTRFSPHVQFSTRLGAARLSSSSLTVVTLDPAVAAILGVTEGIQAAYQTNYLPDLEARLAYNVRRSGLTLEYMNNVVPGNGVYVTSRNNLGFVSYSYSGIRHWNFGVDASYGRMTSLGQNVGAYTAYGAGIGFTRDLAKGLHWVMRFDDRRFSIASSSFKHAEYRATAGITFAPGDIPLSLW